MHTGTRWTMFHIRPKTIYPEFLCAGRGGRNECLFLQRRFPRRFFKVLCATSRLLDKSYISLRRPELKTFFLSQSVIFPGLPLCATVCCGVLWFAANCCALLWTLLRLASTCYGLLWFGVVRCGLLCFGEVCNGLMSFAVAVCSLLRLPWIAVVCHGMLWLAAFLWFAKVCRGLVWCAVVCCDSLWLAVATYGWVAL